MRIHICPILGGPLDVTDASGTPVPIHNLYGEFCHVEQTTNDEIVLSVLPGATMPEKVSDTPNAGTYLSDVHQIALAMQKQVALAEQQAASLESIASSLKIVSSFYNLITGMQVDPQKGTTMAKTQFKRGLKAARKFKVGDPVASFVLTDDPNNPGNYVVHATNLAGDVLDVSAVATISLKDDGSGNATFATTGPVTFSAQGVKQGATTLTITLTWTDGSVGPFTGDVAFTVNAGGPTGLVVTPA